MKTRRTAVGITSLLLLLSAALGLLGGASVISAAGGNDLPASTTPSFTDTPTSDVGQDLLSGSEYAPDEVLVELDSSASITDIIAALGVPDVSVESEIDALGITLLKIPPGQVLDMVDRLSVVPGVLHAEPNYIATIADTVPNDPGWSSQYGLIAVRAPQGWDLSTGSSSVVVALVDTGVDLSHSDLAGKLVAGYDFANGDAIPQDDNGHGTHVAGIAAAVSNNSVGVAGVSWGARVMPVKVLNALGNGTFANVAAGIVWAADNGAQVINLSLGGSCASTVLQDAVNYAYGKGTVLVAAAGNTGANSVLCPARYPNVIAVAATDAANLQAAFSNYGPEISVSAPGVSIYSTALGGAYGNRSGTSMSTPYVSGLAAILIGVSGLWSPASIRAQIESTALDLGAAGQDDFYGFGLIQMDAAILVALPTATPIVPINPPPQPTAEPPQPTAIPPTETPPPVPAVTPVPSFNVPEISIQQVLPTATFTLTPSATASATATATASPTFTPTSTSTSTATLAITRIAVPPLSTEPVQARSVFSDAASRSICLALLLLLLLIVVAIFLRRKRRR